ncbi:hypothetical protein [Aminobacter sp. MET-1]|uniref:hypothetical protein n=1 Tax=Aminobacter sp. MET-1 TaxID=2951085 RepID=UPI0022698845|nr:hypothetical protein [Aminobacter sp. MET-1]MCX8571103.1 hypothetical protein [Aminobacter sp. MET-1]MCX8573228.1 hypothetical protein [Aminobacter sp. MET-1]
MNQTVSLSITGLVSLLIGVGGGYAVANNVQATKIADLTTQLATLQKQVDEYQEASRLDAPTSEEASAALQSGVFSGGSISVDECQKDTVTPGVVCSGLVVTKNGTQMPKTLRFVKIGGVWTSEH